MHSPCLALALSEILPNPRSAHPPDFIPTAHSTSAAATAPAAADAGLLKAFRGKLGELLRHPAGNQVVDDLWAGEAGQGRWLGGWAVWAVGFCAYVMVVNVRDWGGRVRGNVRATNHRVSKFVS